MSEEQLQLFYLRQGALEYVLNLFGGKQDLPFDQRQKTLKQFIEMSKVVEKYLTNEED